MRSLSRSSLNSFWPRSRSSLTAVWNVRIAFWVRANPPLTVGVAAAYVAVRPGLDSEHHGEDGYTNPRNRYGHCSAVPPGPSPRPPRQWLPPGGDRLVGRPPLDVVGQPPRRWVTVLG